MPCPSSLTYPLTVKLCPTGADEGALMEMLGTMLMDYSGNYVKSSLFKAYLSAE